ncbi:MAG: BON domain-containing protein [Candidatus Angelobacter sp.]
METDTELQRDVIAELACEPMIDPSEIGVTARDGIVTLTGTVKSQAQKLAALQAAERVLEVRAVIDEMHVELSCTQHRRDEVLGRAVLNALKWDTRVPDDRIKFNVSHGLITLEGTVDYGYQREATEKAIRVLQGVKHIENRIEVKAPVAPVDLKTGVEKRSSADGRRK